MLVWLVAIYIYISFFRFLRAGNFLSVELVLLLDFIWEAEMPIGIFSLIQYLGHWLIRFEKGHYFVLLLFYALSWPWISFQVKTNNDCNPNVSVLMCCFPLNKM